MGLIEQFKKLFSKSRNSFEEESAISDREKISESPDNQTRSSSSVSMEHAFGKSKEFIEATAEEVKEQSSALWHELKDQVSHLEESTRETREKLILKAKQGLDKIEDIIDTTVEKAKAEKAEEDKMDENRDGIADNPVNFGDPIEKKHSDFFDKAEKWVKENESKESTLSSDNTLNSGKVLKPLELPKEPGE